MLAHLRSVFDITIVVRQPWTEWFGSLRRLISFVTRGKVDLAWSPYWSALGSRKARKTVAQSDVDIVFCVGVSPICALLSGEKPTVFISDATVAGLLDYNPKFTALSSAYRRHAIAIETRAVSLSVAAFYPSEWARNDAIRYHGASPTKTHVVNWGANLEADYTQLPGDIVLPWKLLFIGVNWKAKGGNIAVDAVRLLSAMGVAVQLDVVGSRPSNLNISMSNITFHGFLDKNVFADRTKLNGLFRSANLLLFPTQFEALGIVTAEAASFGAPTIAYRTGGVAANILDGKTGILLPAGAPPQLWASTINTLLKDRPRYDAMRRAAIAWHRTTLNWPTWANAVASIIDASDRHRDKSSGTA